MMMMKQSFRQSAIIVSFLFAGVSLAQTAWPQFRGPSGNGLATDPNAWGSLGYVAILAVMSSALALHLKGRSKGFLSAFAYGVTDESFAVNLTRFGRGAWTPEQALIVNQTSNLVWFVSTVAGGYLGDGIPQGAFGIDYALTAMFLGLLVLQVRDWLLAAVALLAGLIAVGLKLLGPGNWQVIAATVIAASVGLIVTERWPKLARGQR